MSKPIPQVLKMAEQIAINNPCDNPQESAEFVQLHLEKSWPISMRRELINVIQNNASEVSTAVRSCAKLLEKTLAKKDQG